MTTLFKPKFFCKWSFVQLHLKDPCIYSDNYYITRPAKAPCSWGLVRQNLMRWLGGRGFESRSAMFFLSQKSKVQGITKS